MQKFVIFATARTGSTSLAITLADSPDVEMAIEPFHPNYNKWNSGARNYSKFIMDAKTLDIAYEELFSKFTAIKVLDYQLPGKLYKRLLSKSGLKIIFLRRKNLFNSTLSSFVAEQVGEYHKTQDNSIYDNLKPIDVDEFSRMINYVREMNSFYADYLEQHKKGEFMPLFYETLYSESLEENVNHIKEITLFLGVSMPPFESIKMNMSPRRAKINYDNVYKKVPNFEELKKQFDKQNGA